jgi:hypothetical protein
MVTLVQEVAYLSETKCQSDIAALTSEKPFVSVDLCDLPFAQFRTALSSSMGSIQQPSFVLCLLDVLFVILGYADLALQAGDQLCCLRCLGGVRPKPFPHLNVQLASACPTPLVARLVGVDV